MKQGAVVRVLFDDKPVPGTTVHIRSHLGSHDTYLFTTDEAGTVKLPELLPGSYSIYASSPDIDVCVVMCIENAFELTEFGFDNLRGPVYEIDRSALGMSEIIFDLAPDRMPEFREPIDPAEPVEAFTLSEFRGVVTDQTGAVIPGASVAVMTKPNGQDQNGQNQYGHDQLVASLSTNQVGEFSASLGPGDYYVVVSAQAFRSKAIHIVIAPDGSPEKAQVRLRVGSSTTQIITVSEYRPSPS
jgi:hypothetical protein